MRKNNKYIMLIVALLLLLFEGYIIGFLKDKEVVAIPVISNEVENNSINDIFEEIMNIEKVSILEIKLVDSNLVTKINIKGNRNDVNEKVKLLSNFRVNQFNINSKDAKIDITMEIVKK